MSAIVGPGLTKRRFSMSCEKQQSYEVLVADGVLEREGLFRDTIHSRRALVITTPTVSRLYGHSLQMCIDASGADAVVEVMPLSEGTKHMDSVLAICAAAHGHGLARGDVLIAFGGGICCDLVTVASGLFRRGIPYICVPTTLVGQVDAGIGLKGAVNFVDRKNYLGCFAAPAQVLVDPTFLVSTELADVRAGVGEIVKMALIRDAELFASLAEHGKYLIKSRFNDSHYIGRRVIARSIELMLEELEPNSYEDRTLRRLVDFGHTFSGKLEELSGFQLRHGLAVSLDIAVSTAIAVQLGLLPATTGQLITRTLVSLGLPINSALVTTDNLREAAQATSKHRAGALNLVVPTAIGRAEFIPTVAELTPGLINASLDWLHREPQVMHALSQTRSIARIRKSWLLQAAEVE
jgi:3-dehydroquinate synthetase